jgi:DNA-binding MarR family transcriptional regulator
MSAPKVKRADRNPSVSGAGEAALLGESIRDVVSRLVKVVREQSGTHSNAQNETLSLLERTGPVSISALAMHRTVTHQTMRLIVMKLVEQGLVTLMQDAEDRRAYVVDLTDEGRAQNAHERSARSQWLTDRLMTKTSREERAMLEIAVRTLHKLID